MEPLKQTHHLRSKVNGHLAESEKLAIISERDPITDHLLRTSANWWVRFRRLSTESQGFFERLGSAAVDASYGRSADFFLMLRRDCLFRLVEPEPNPDWFSILRSGFSLLDFDTKRQYKT